METKQYLNEVWKPIRGWENLYEASNFGRVRSLDRYFNNRRGKALRKGKILRPSLNAKGYYQVALYKDFVVKYITVHRLVAIAFIPNPHNYPCINHKDENKTNNFVWVNTDGSIDPDRSNIEWCTQKYNINYGTVQERRIKSRRKQVS